MTALTVVPRADQRPYQAFGAAEQLLYAREMIVGLDGPAGTGKSRGALEKLHILMQRYPGARGLILRKTRASLTESALVTWESKVVPGDHPMFSSGGQRKLRQNYLYPNGSEIIIGGLDKPEKIMSTEFDVIYVQEMTECTEDDIEKALTRLRNGVIPYQQLIFDCNPQMPSHWIKQRAKRDLRLIPSRHEDNPELWDRAQGCWTARGEQYLAVLDALTGVRKDRLRYGRWVMAEGMVFEAWDPVRHVIDTLPFGVAEFRTVAASVDWGFTNPGVIEVWGEDGDGRLYLLHEVYQTHKTIDWWVERAKQARDQYGVRTFVCDPSEPAYISQFNAAGLRAVGANNAVAPGIQTVQQRLPVTADGRPRLFVLRTALAERDAARDEQKCPCGLLEEIEGYVWDTSSNRKRGEEPVKHDDHSMDALRYACVYFERSGPSVAPVSLSKSSSWRV